MILFNKHMKIFLRKRKNPLKKVKKKKIMYKIKSLNLQRKRKNKIKGLILKW